MPASPRSALVSGALDALTTSKPTVLDAVAHLTADLPRARLLSLRLAPSVANATEARRMVDALGSAALLEHFSAMPFELAGACDEALEVRLDALRIAPRYDPWLCARILAGATRCLLKARRHDEARATASRALAFLPGDPTALSLLATVEEATGNAGQAHAIWARLRDDGYAPPLVTDVAPDVEREIVPFSIDLDALEPMSDDELADYLVYTRLDVSATDAPLQPRRNAANLLRRGDPGGARIALCRAADWECLATRSMYWMGVAVDQDDMAANEALLAAIEATPEGARARSLSEKRGLVSRFSLAIPTRLEALRTLVAAGTVDEAARLIADWTFSVRLEAMAALPAHPTSARVAALAAQVDPSLPGRTVMGTPGEAASFHGSNGMYRRGDQFVEYPTPPLGARDPMARKIRFPPMLRHASSARGACAVCKEKLQKGELRLETTAAGARKRADKLVHPLCAASSKAFTSDFREAFLRQRLSAADRAELESLARK